MTYRDDHEAALERIDALEADLARERADRQKSDARALALERELAVEGALADSRTKHPERGRTPPPSLAPAAPTSLETAAGARSRSLVRWSDIELRIADYKRRASVVPVISFGGALIVVLLAAATKVGGLLLAIPVPAFFAALYDMWIQVPCPACKERFAADRTDRDLDRLRSLHQCPHCQTKFE